MREHVFDIGGRTLAALAWGEETAPPLLALHGWLDNAESFAPLAEHLSGYYLLAIDCAGHGRSDHRSPDGEYNIWNDLPDILSLVDQLGWKTLRLLGHSRGAAIAGLFAAAFPERVSHLALLDGFSPPAGKAEDTPAQFNRYVRDRRRLLAKGPRDFSSLAEAVSTRHNEQLGPASAERIVRRNLVPHGDGWRWSTDPRLLGASALRLTDAHNAAIISALTMPTLLVLAEDGLSRYEGLGTAHIPLPFETLPGKHHFHMEASARPLALRLQAFFSESVDA